ncbi:uncharacterized protein LOC129913568 [Episyrphus balteatus]|uniref:uncharacterized protein LOC129913568 n=1 Tax=Episyrphus balteatus TaxID=286459 RepID=UPI002486BC12|nr:uncharacterized protein LOC129913568 [Episyrphus balteatus]
MEDNCSGDKCDKRINRNDDYVLCSGMCGKKFHIKCVELSKFDMTLLKNNARIKFMCIDCPNILSALSKQIAEIAKNNIELKKIVDEAKNISVPTPTQQKVSYAQTLKENSEVIVVKPKTDQNNEKTINDLKNVINPRNMKLKINEVKNVQNGGILIKCDKKSVKTIENEIKTNMSEYVAKIQEHRNPRINIVGMSETISEEDLVEAIKCQNMINDSDIKCVKIYLSHKTKKYNAIVEVNSVTNTNIMNMGKLNIGWDRCRVYQYIRVLKCYNCCGYNHIAKYCNKNKICMKCAGNHDVKDCNSDIYKCANCVSLNEQTNLQLDTHHAASDNNCPVFLRKLKAVENRDSF